VCVLWGLLMGDILISVIIPTYNRSDLICEAVSSVLDQTYQNWEVIVVDDGSEDNTKSALGSFLNDHRINYVYQKNQGQSVARNNGIALSTGNYICFLDSDNKWLPEKLKVSVDAALENPDVDVIYGDNITIDINGDELSRDTMKKYSGRITYRLLRDNFISMNTTMTKRRCFEEMGGLDEGDRLAEDYELWLRMSTRYSFLHIPVYVGFYRVMENQLSTDKDKRFAANFKIINEFIERYPNSVTWGQKRRGFSGFFWRKASYEKSVGRYSRAWKDFAYSVSYWPFWSGPWKLLVKMVVGR
jgi:glycosyltransferase involved in cell wall biosynthesis